jgi:hypothetical protein
LCVVWVTDYRQTGGRALLRVGVSAQGLDSAPNIFT